METADSPGCYHNNQCGITTGSSRNILSHTTHSAPGTLPVMTTGPRGSQMLAASVQEKERPPLGAREGRPVGDI